MVSHTKYNINLKQQTILNITNLMKKLLLLVTLFISFLTFAQVPQGISYQAIALNGSGAPVVSSNVRVKLSILDATVTGTVLYSETHLKTTNANGLFILTIGQGTVLSGSFNTINWGTNSKFLKVEMDATGGTTYALVGTTQLLSVPYALAADSLVTSPGEGITLVSPNGTPYTLSVNDNGELSLPTSNQPSNSPSDLYLYGTFNSWNAATALHFGGSGGYFYGYKYFTAGTQVKFLTGQNTNVIYGGNGSNGSLTQNGNAITIPSAGFYKITVQDGNYSITSANVVLNTWGGSSEYTMSYNVASGYFYYSYTQSDTFDHYRFIIGGDYYGDNIADGTIEQNGAEIYTSNGEKLFKLYVNFDGTGNYTISSIPTNSYLIGAFQGWNPANGLPMTNTSPGVFQITYNFASATTIKFITALNWNNAYGGSAGVLVSSGNDIPVTAGNHTLTVNYGNMTYTIN